MKTDIWMPLYINDFLADTLHLSAEEAGAYMLIIMNYWKRGAIGGDIERISRFSRIAPSITQALLEEFFFFAGGEWKHPRIEKELQIARENKAKRGERAKRAAAARWGNNYATSNAQGNATSNAQSIPEAMPEDMREECPSSSPSPLPIKEEEKTPLPPRGGTERSPLDCIIDFWNERENLPRSPMACNLPNPGKLADIIIDYGPEYVKDAISSLSANIEDIERKYRPGSIKTFLENSVSRWHDFQGQRQALSEEDEAFIAEVKF